MKNVQFVHKYRSRTIDDIILAPRIYEIFKNHETEGLAHSYIFHGKFGLGKTSLAKIVGGYYHKKNPYLLLNVSKDTSINLLRDKIEPFCRNTQIDLNNDTVYDSNVIKVVIMDEFDRASIQLQEGLKAFTEEWEPRGVRFIGVTNHINRIDGGLKSRFTYINFNPKDSEEINDMKLKMKARIYRVIAPAEKIEIPKQTVSDIVDQCFPDFRSCIRLTEHFAKYGYLDKEVIADLSVQVEFIDMVLNKSVKYDTFYHYLMTKFGDMGIGSMLDMLERPLIEFMFQNNMDTEPLFDINAIIVKYKSLLPNATDPILIGMATIGEIRNTLKKK